MPRLEIAGVLMGIQERKQKQFAEREQLFLDAAREQICRDGLLGLQMARVARACDYATGTLYQHFASKEDLLVAICNELVAKRVDVFFRARDWQAASRARMLAVAVGDTLFARRHPEHFRITQYVLTEVVWQAASAGRRQQLLNTSRPMGEAVAQIISDALAAGDVDARDRPLLELSLGQWTMTWGTHNLVHAEGMLELYDLHDPYRLLLRHLNALLNGLGWQPFVDPFDDGVLEQQISVIHTTLFADLCSSTELD